MDNKINSTTQTPNQHVHEYVDLGLPSGTLWATENIKDADGNELYFAWGETIGHTAEQVHRGIKEFSWDDYKFGSIDLDDETNYGMTKYNKTDGLMILEPEDDAATQNWGDEWKMPTREQFKELMDRTDQKWMEVNGIKGLLCTSRTNGNTIFFSAIGSAGDGGVDDGGYHGGYWSVSLYTVFVHGARDFYFSNCDHGVYYNNRYYGCSVRPVRV